MAQGHDATKLPDYSLEAVRLYYRNAQEQQSKADAAHDLRFARGVRIAVGSLLDKKNGQAWRKFEQALMALINDEPPNQRANITALASVIMRMGAKAA